VKLHAAKTAPLARSIVLAPQDSDVKTANVPPSTLAETAFAMPRAAKTAETAQRIALAPQVSNA